MLFHHCWTHYIKCEACRTSVFPQIPFYVNLFLIAVKVWFKHNWKIHRCWVFHYGRYKVLALRQSDTHRPESNSDIMAQIRGGAATLVLLLTVSLFCQDTAAWGKTFSFSLITMQLERQNSVLVNCSWHVILLVSFNLWTPLDLLLSMCFVLCKGTENEHKKLELEDRTDIVYANIFLLFLIYCLGCCRRYSKGQLPVNLIRGYSIQDINANCNINAVMWVSYTVHILMQRLSFFIPLLFCHVLLWIIILKSFVLILFLVFTRMDTEECVLILLSPGWETASRIWCKHKHI